MTLLYPLFIIYILLPKLDIISLSGSAIRLTDLIYLVVIAIYLQYRGFVFPRMPIVGRYMAFIGIAFVSLVINNGITVPFAILNVVRLLQYMSWIYIGRELARGGYLTKERFARDMARIGLLLFFWAVLEAAHLIPKLGKFSSASARVSVNTSGPFEIAAIAAFLFFVSKGRAPKVATFIIAALSQARITIAIMALVGSWRRVRVFAPLALLAVPFILLVPWRDMFAGTRFGMVAGLDDIMKSLEFYWANVKLVHPTYASGSMLDVLDLNANGSISDISPGNPPVALDGCHRVNIFRSHHHACRSRSGLVGRRA